MINHRISLESLRQSQHKAASEVKKYYKMIQLIENEIMILEARSNNLQKTFDATMDEYVKGKASYLVFKTYLHELKDTEILLEQKKYQHAANKISLAKAVGVYDFPADGFSNLATKDLK